MSDRADALERLLQQCADEPIRVPGKIQPFGCLVAARKSDARILYASDNVDQFLAQSSQDVLGAQGPHLLGESVWESAVQSSTGQSVGTSYRPPEQDQRLYVTAHHAPPYYLLEIEPFDEVDREAMGKIQAVQDDLLSQTGIRGTLESGVNHVARLTGYEHIMLYRFHDNWDGEVVAEVPSEAMPRYQGHRFPASDIPPQARELYRENTFRIIPDTRYEPAAVVGQAEEPLDLSQAWLRSVSPVHLQYLENMGVRASLSISIIVNARLWGLIACHHRRPRLLPHGIRRLVAFYGQHFSTRLSLQLESDRQDYVRQYADVLRLSHNDLREGVSIVESLQSRIDDLLAVMQAEGLIVHLEGETRGFGSVPPPAARKKLISWLEDQELDEIWYTDHLAAHYAEGRAITDTASGILVVGLPHDEGNMMIWLRPEVLQTIRWGGNPNTPVRRNEKTKKLSPRNSFETWQEKVQERSQRWESIHIEAARVFRQHLLEAVIVAKSVRQSQQFDIINRVLSHDIQNSVGVMVAYADMIGRLDDADKDRYVSRILRVGQDTIGIARSASALAQAIRKGEDLERGPVDVAALIDRLVGPIDAAYSDAFITVDRSEMNDDTVFVSAGPLLESVLRNLIQNGIKHNDKERKRVRVSIEERASTVRIHVADNGPGIPASRRKEIFAEGETQLKASSGGIGLYLVHLITHRYDGRVWVADNEPEGTVFTVELNKPE